MAYPKGAPRPPASGRAKGTVNKATVLGREAIASFVDDNAHRLASWLDKIAEVDPDAAFKAYMSVVEYHIPKLNRHSIENADNKPFQTVVGWMKSE